MDLIAPWRPEWKGRTLVVAGHAAGLVIIVVAALWAPAIGNFGSVVKYFQQLLAYIAPPVVAVFLAGLFWKRASATGAFTALLTGFGLGAGLLLLGDRSPLAGWNFLYVVPILFAVSLALLVGVSWLTPGPSPETVARYVWTPAFFRSETGALAGVPWFRNYRVLAVLLLLVTAAFVYVWR
jgi:SSS family solute:Na+ symporter